VTETFFVKTEWFTFTL